MEHDPFAGCEDQIPSELADSLRQVSVIDHHVHGYFTEPVERQAFEDTMNEGSITPTPGHITMFQSPLGVAIRRWCAPALGLPPHASAEEYWEARSARDVDDLARTFLGAAGVHTWVVDTGFASDAIATPPQIADLTGVTAVEIARLESILASLLGSGVAAHDVPDALRQALADLPDDVVGAKTVAAYRCGLDIDWTPPTTDVVRAAAAEVLARGEHERISDPTLIAFAAHAALERGLPLQVHIGYGDRDLDLHRANPLHLLPLMRSTSLDVPILLLHCYPYHREAAYLAQAFDHVHFDVGLAINFLGAGSPRLIGEALELAPFAKQLYSSDAFGLPELHLLGALLWRRGMGLTVGEWVRRGDWSLADALDAVELIGHRNATRVYGVSGR